MCKGSHKCREIEVRAMRFVGNKILRCIKIKGQLDSQSLLDARWAVFPLIGGNPFTKHCLRYESYAEKCTKNRTRVRLCVLDIEFIVFFSEYVQVHSPNWSASLLRELIRTFLSLPLYCCTSICSYLDGGIIALHKDTLHKLHSDARFSHATSAKHNDYTATENKEGERRVREREIGRGKRRE